MKKLVKLFVVPFALLSLTGCDFISDVFGGGDTDTIHKKSYEPITGKFVLYEATDKRLENPNAYFEFDGTKGNFSLKYYENGELKISGIIARLVTRLDDVGYWSDNLHFNIKEGNEHYHISTYTESFDPINQFRIIDEVDRKDDRYYLSEMPCIMGTYVRENQEYIEEKPHKNDIDYMTPTIDNFTSALDGTYKLDDEHYFYFLSPKAWSTANGGFLNSYFQYYSSALSSPIEGFVMGYSYDYSSTSKLATLYLKTVKKAIDWGESTEGSISFGYSTFDEKDNMIDHYGSVDFSNGVLHSITFEHLSRPWTDKEWDEFISNPDYHLPDPILYDYIGGTYNRV